MPQKRNRRSGVEDRWTKSNGEPSVNHGKGKRWRARYVDASGDEHAKGFVRKADAQKWLDTQTAAVVGGTHVAPRDAQLTVGQWCDMWIEGYKVNRDSTVRQARTHIVKIVEEFGGMALSALRPSQVKAWIAKLNNEYEPSYVHALHSRLSQILSDAVHDGVLARNPCSRRTSPPMGKQKPYVATTEQVWALHDAMPEHLQVAIELGAFVGLRVAEAAALRTIEDVDFMRGIVHPQIQWPNEPLKTDGSDAEIPIPNNLSLMLSSSVQMWPGDRVVTNGRGGHAAPWTIEREFRTAREKVKGLPEGFRFHDLRHYLASLLIASGADIKTVQARMRHASARTTLDTYGHLWPDADESTRTAVGAVIAERVDPSEATADALRTKAPSGRGRRRSAR
ncbi:site-specific integrase [Mycobacteroides abscessus]|uniref:tyrosine-type recombinase/integrase n=1 Tax=Mycobacteroides abscessus TaxID=36809 RepID=UPI000C25887D|nr:site-specific integrase [Mycobacteroides abscessus]PVB45680.1 site-specific integrase [Mycobacteroides abscessus]RIR72601.1 site-specific integrase [Mycobacteroides abscessus]